jgi:hypothetical protein
VPLEVGPDRLVAEAARGERLGPRPGEALVVDVADALERVERLGPRLLRDACFRETRVDLPPRTVAVAQRARRELDRVGLIV